MQKTACGGWYAHGSTRSLTAKTLLVVNLTFVLLTAAFLNVCATGVSQQVSFSGKNVPLETVLSSVKKQTGFVFIYTDLVVKASRPVTINAHNLPLDQFLSEVFKSQPLQYDIKGRSIFISRKVASSDRQLNSSDQDILPPTDTLIDVRGRVVNEKGEPVEGVTVSVKRATQKTVTDKLGGFSLETKEEHATLVFTHISMETLEWKVNGKSDLVINLRTRITALGDVEVTVNTGYQNVSRERYVGSASTLDSAAYNRRAGMNIIDRLDGTIPGLVFIKNNGSTPMQIRGISTMGFQSTNTSFQPLIVVDNFPFKGNIQSINPNDVESITVLKDAAATSVWGTLGGNGVVVITTKKGSYNQGLRVSVASNVTVREKPDLYYQPQMSIADYVDVEKFLFGKGFYNASLTNTSTRPVISPVVEVLAKRRAGLITANDSATQIANLMSHDLRADLDKYVYRNAVYQQHYLNASGGNDLLNFTLGIGMNNSKPNLQHVNSDKQFTLNSSISYKPVKNLEIETGINLAKNTNRSIGLGSGISYPIKIAPYAALADDQGNALPIPNDIRMAWADTTGGGRLLNWLYRPLDEIRGASNDTKTSFARINLGASYKITKWLKAEIRYQYLQENGNVRVYYSATSYYARNMINRFTQISGSTVNRRIPPGGILDVANSQGTSNNIRGQLNINKRWNAVHELNALVATEVSETKSSSNSNRLYGYNDEYATYTTGLDYNSLYSIYGNLSGSQRISQQALVGEGPNNRFVSLLANASYTYQNRYTVYASARRDGANVFGVKTNNKWKPLWSAGASWELSKENFFNISRVSMLRLKASYGYSGNVDNNRSGLPTIVYGGPATFTGYPTAVAASPPNPDLRWEQVGITNLALEFAVLKNRISGSFEWFEKKSKDLIAPTAIDATTGMTSFTVNIASLRGRGYDLRLSSINLNGPLKWESTVALSYVKVIVTKFDNGGFKTNQFINFSVNPTEGQIAWGVSSYRFAGLDPNTGDPQGILNKTVSKDYLKIFDDSLKNQVFHGSLIPLYSGFLFNSFSWKGITLSANITYRFKYFFRKTTISYASLFNDWRGHADFEKRWKAPKDELVTTVPSMTYPANINRDLFYINSEVNVKRADNIRLQDLRLAYNLVKRAGNRMPVKNVQVFLYANDLNMILWRKDKVVLDPDFQTSVIPPSRSLTAGLNINF